MGRITVRGSQSESIPEIDAVISDINEHGEVHATFEETEEEVELRIGTTIVDLNRRQFIIEGADTTHYFAFDRLVSYYKPTEVYH